jgi:hypothetical protein
VVDLTLLALAFLGRSLVLLSLFYSWPETLAGAMTDAFREMVPSEVQTQPAVNPEGSVNQRVREF